MMNKPLTLMLLLCTAVLPAMTTLGDSAKTLEDAGLSRVGMEYVLEDENEIIRARNDIKQAQRELKEAEDDFRDADRKIAKAQAYIAHLQKEADDLESRRLRASSQNQHARIVEEIREIAKLIEKTQEERKKFEEEQQVKMDDAKANYIATMVTWVEKAAVINEKYAKLAEQKDINDAITEISEQDKRKYVLGPSRRFESINRELAKAAGEYQRGAVDLRVENKTLWIDVRINGKPIRSMILDTGASSVSLPFLFAKDLGIEVTDADPVVQLQMADGKIVDAKQVSLASVQVGEFIINDVQAFVLPESLHAAPALLGNTFLSNFTYEVDPVRGKLILSRLTEKE